MRHHALSLSLAAGLVMALGANPAPAQACQVACDINARPLPIGGNPHPSRWGSGETYVQEFVWCNGAWFFAGYDCQRGRELWKTDGTPAGTVLVRDIAPGPGDSSPFWLTCVGSTVSQTLFFQANDGVNGLELWKSDGTAAGTVLVRDINPGPDGSTPQSLEAMGSVLVFAAAEPATGIELWKSDGTAAGTVLVRDIYGGGNSSYPRHLRYNPVRGELYFNAFDTLGNELWKTDGTTAGTVLVRDIDPSGNGLPINLVNLGSNTLFVANSAGAGSELWSTDGTFAGTVMVRDINPGTGHSSPGLFYSVECGGFLYFAADDPVTGRELWRTDGTLVGTTLVANLDAAATSSSPSHLHVNGSTIFLSAQTSAAGRELWRYDCTTSTFNMVRDIAPGSAWSDPTGFASVGSRVLFSASDGTGGLELFVSDGTLPGTQLVRDINPGAPNGAPQWLTPIGFGHVLFTAYDAARGSELWTSDGTTAGTNMFFEFETAIGSGPANPTDVVCAWGTTIYMSADDGSGLVGREPYVFSDARGCALLRDVRAGPFGSNPSQFTPCWTGGRGLVFFVATDITTGTELWVSDGTTTGTMLVRDINPGAVSSSPSNLRACGDRLFFTANNGSSGVELWASDGTTAGTYLVMDINPGPSPSTPSSLVCCKGKLYFAAQTASGIELWGSDGTTAGTAMVSDIHAGAASSSPADLVCCPDVTGTPFLLFSAFTAAAGRELWRSDGTNAGTLMVADIVPGATGSGPVGLVCCGSRVWFRATTPAASTEPWVSDGTLAGTFLLRDLRPGAIPSTPAQFTCCNGRVVFVASGEIGGNPIGGEVHVTDGTQAGTVPLADIYPGAGGSAPSGLVSVGSRVYFSATRQPTGIELWRTDGTPAGTQLACDIWPGVASGQPASMLGCCCRLYFVATDPKVNRELHVVPEPGATVEEVGLGCVPSHPTMHATPPFLGQVSTLRGECAPANHAGIVLLSAKVDVPYAVPSRCAGYINFFGPWFSLGVVLPPSWTLPLPIPNNPALLNVCLATQTWWLSLAAITPFQTTNAVLLGLGL